MKNENSKKGNFEHKIFKGVVLILVFAFFLLIFYFIYVQVAETFTGHDLKENNKFNKYTDYFIERVFHC